MQSEWRLQVFSLPFTLHWRCNISENLLFVRLWREFIVNLWVNWNLGCLKNCFQSPGSSVRLHSLCTLFQCVLRLSGIVLRFRAPESAEILRGVCSHVNIDDLHLAIFTISGVKPTFGTYWCVTLPYLDRFLWNFVMYLSPTGATSGSITNLLLFFFQIWQAYIWWKSGIFIVLEFTCHYYNS